MSLGWTQSPRAMGKGCKLCLGAYRVFFGTGGRMKALDRMELI